VLVSTGSPNSVEDFCLEQMIKYRHGNIVQFNLLLHRSQGPEKLPLFPIMCMRRELNLILADQSVLSISASDSEALPAEVGNKAL